MNRKTTDQRILKLAMTDTVRNSFIALPIIALFEVFMIIRWLLNKKAAVSPGSLSNLAAYITLLVITVISIGFVFWIRRDFDKRYRKMTIIQLNYALLFVIWALWLTFVGCHFYNSFDYLVYITIITIVPVFCFIPMGHWTAIQLCSAALVVYMAYPFDRFEAFFINFTVFTIISLLGGWSMFQIRLSLYKKQIALQDERDCTHQYAYFDSLTGLPNRRSYVEALEAVARQDQSSLIMAMFDVNGLKTVNDTLGHEAGDELLQGAAQCLTQAFSARGTVYRVGGDEFTGIFNCSEEDMLNAVSDFQTIIAAWKGSLVNSLSVSIGTASRKAHPDLSLVELEVLADNTMYAVKNQYYANKPSQKSEQRDRDKV